VHDIKDVHLIMLKLLASTNNSIAQLLIQSGVVPSKNDVMSFFIDHGLTLTKLEVNIYEETNNT